MHRWRWAKELLENVPVVLVRDGVINIESAVRRDMNPLELMERMRLQGVRNLGEVEWAFLEPDGSVSLFRRRKPVDGLSIVPPHDVNPPLVSLDEAGAGGRRCCRVCGMVVEVDSQESVCANCRSEAWVVPTCASGDGED